jgi:hypothetical protein
MTLGRGIRQRQFLRTGASSVQAAFTCPGMPAAEAD